MQVKADLRDFYTKNDTNKNGIENLIDASKVAKNLMMDLLDLAQTENNTFRVNNSTISMLEVVEDAFTVVAHIAESKNVKLVPPQLKEVDA
jgi:signal transduction histidine kinase